MRQPADNIENAHEQALLAIGYHLDQYEIEAILAIGDFRISYYAWDHQKNRNVVIQEYFPRSLAIRTEDGFSVTSQLKDRFTDYEFGLSEFLLEARLVSEIRSAYLPNVIEYREANGTGYLVSEYDDGKTLREILDSESGYVSEHQIKELLRAGLQGLRELHARNLLHTSVSPLNLFIRFHGHPLLLGQGLARYRLAQYTKIWNLKQAPGYTALEQYSLDGNIGPWSDLYALGASLYECVSGVCPVDASIRHTALIKDEEDPLTPAAEIGQGRFSSLLLSNIDWMLKPYVEDRPDSADLMLGVVSFQKQSESIKNKKSGTTYISTTRNTTPVSDKSNQESTEKTSDSVETEPRPEKGKTGTFGYLAWGLGLLITVFIAITGYQVYKHELLVRQTSAQQAETTLAERLTIDTQPSVPEPVIPGATDEEIISRDISRQSDEQRRTFYENLVREEEIERRVEEQLAIKLEEQNQEFEAEQERQQKAEKQNQQTRVEELLGQAEAAKLAENLYQANSENAFAYYHQVLDIQPGNEAALQGITDIADHLYEQATNEIGEQNAGAASLSLKQLIAVRPEDERVESLITKITNLKAQIQVLEFQARQEQIQPLEDKPVNQPKFQTAPETAETAAPVPAEIQVESVVNRIQLASDYHRYENGDYTVDLYEKIANAAQSDEGRAKYILAEMYAAGRGTQQDLGESAQWLKESMDYVNQQARYGQPWAEKAMGVIYEKGWFVDASPESAVRWYRSSAEKGFAPAQYRLGLAYARGLGVTKNTQTAREWFKKALSNGNLEAKKALSKLPVQN